MKQGWRHSIGCLLCLGLLWSCTKYDDLPELEYNRWVEELPNPIQVDSIRVVATDSQSADVRIYLQFDRMAYESEWDEVQQVRVAFDLTSSEDEEELTSIVNLSPSGVGEVTRGDLMTKTSYEMRHQIELVNGRTSVWSRSFTIDTPSF